MILITENKQEQIDYLAAMKAVQTDHGVGLYKQAFQMLRFATSKNKIHPGDYFEFLLFRPSLSADAKTEFLSYTSNLALNSRLAPPDLANHNSLLADKLLSGLLLKSSGFPVPNIKAVYSENQQYYTPRTLRTRDEIIKFITDKKNLPVFGKPGFGSRSIGCISIIARSPDKTEITLGDMRQVNASELASEIAAHYSDGYLFQEVLEQPGDIQNLVGPTAATIRICTVQLKDGPQVLYAVWKLPKKCKAIDYWGDAGVRGYALIDVADGKVTRVHKKDGLNSGPVTYSISTGKPLIGIAIPDWKTCKDLAISAHNLFPDHGLLGWDIILTKRGPVINEVNTNPLHLIYQNAADRGFFNPDFMPLLRQAQDLITTKQTKRKSRKNTSNRFSLNRKI